MPWLENTQKRLNALPVSAKAIIAALAAGCIAAVVFAVFWPHSSLSEAEMARMGSEDATKYVFAHQGCSSCHTLNSNWQLGFTARGIELSAGFQGCGSMLAAMNVIGQVRPGDRTPEEQSQVYKFQEFGCSTCHQVMAGQAALTSYGTKLKSLHFPGCALPTCCSRPQR